MRVPLYHVNAFTDRVFAGNPAAVCPLDHWPDEGTMQAIATENSLSETAFFVAEGDKFKIRWFTPTTEVDLCGHATLASAYVICSELEPGCKKVIFQSNKSQLAAEMRGDKLTLDFPALPPQTVTPPERLIEAIGGSPIEALAARDYLVVYGSEQEVRELEPDISGLEGLDRFGVIATAPGVEYDCVSRFFAPAQGIPEDPVTGSAHCTIVPYWADRLGKQEIHAYQASARGGELFCNWTGGDRVSIAGSCVLYMRGCIEIPDSD